MVTVRTQIYRAQNLTRIKGFTFVELIIAILLISILISFAAVNWGAFARKEGSTFLEQFSMEILALQEDAISSYQSRVLQFDLTKNSIESGVIDIERGFEPTRKVATPPDLSLIDAVINGQKTTAGIVQMRFYPIGLLDKAILHFESKKEGWLTIIIWPLTGTLETYNEYIDEAKFNKGDNPA